MNIQRNLKLVMNQNYHTAKLYHMMNLRWANLRSNHSPILLLQMGKVGSSTIKKSLLAQGIGPVYQIHYLTDFFLVNLEKKYRDQFKILGAGTPQHHWESAYIRRSLDHHPDQKWRIISLVREPVSRNVSSFFQNLRVLENNNEEYRVSSFYDFHTTLRPDEMQKMLDFFMNTFDHETPVVYFDREVKPFFGVDVFAEPFDTEKGYQLYRSAKADLLVIRMEDLNRCAANAIKEFFNINHFELVNENIGEKKPYHKLYKSFVEHVCLPSSYLDEMYQSKYARHFYTKKEIEKYRAKWEKDRISTRSNSQPQISQIVELMGSEDKLVTND